MADLRRAGRSGAETVQRFYAYCQWSAPTPARNKDTFRCDISLGTAGGRSGLDAGSSASQSKPRHASVLRVSFARSRSALRESPHPARPVAPGAGAATAGLHPETRRTRRSDDFLPELHRWADAPADRGTDDRNSGVGRRASSIVHLAE